MISSAAAGRVGCMQVKQGSEGLFETLCAVYAIVSRQWEELAGLVQCVVETSRYSSGACRGRLTYRHGAMDQQRRGDGHKGTQHTHQWSRFGSPPLSSYYREHGCRLYLSGRDPGGLRCRDCQPLITTESLGRAPPPAASPASKDPSCCRPPEWLLSLACYNAALLFICCRTPKIFPTPPNTPTAATQLNIYLYHRIT